MDHHSYAIHQVMSWTSLLTILGAFVGVLPALATVVGIVWYVLMIMESRMVQDWRRRRLHRKIVKLKTALAEAEIWDRDLDEMMANYEKRPDPDQAMGIVEGIKDLTHGA